MSKLTMDHLAQAMKSLEGYQCPPPMRILESQFLVKRYQFRFPRSKRKRIRKKWEKDRRNWKSEPSKEIIQTAFGYIAHPVYATQIRKKFEEYRGAREAKVCLWYGYD